MSLQNDEKSLKLARFCWVTIKIATLAANNNTSLNFAYVGRRLKNVIRRI